MTIQAPCQHEPCGNVGIHSCSTCGLIMCGKHAEIRQRDGLTTVECTACMLRRLKDEQRKLAVEQQRQKVEMQERAAREAIGRGQQALLDRARRDRDAAENAARLRAKAAVEARSSGWLGILLAWLCFPVGMAFALRSYRLSRSIGRKPSLGLTGIVLSVCFGIANIVVLLSWSSSG